MSYPSKKPFIPTNKRKLSGKKARVAQRVIVEHAEPPHNTIKTADRVIGRGKDV